MKTRISGLAVLGLSVALGFAFLGAAFMRSDGGGGAGPGKERALTSEEYGRLRAEFVGILEHEDPGAAIGRLKAAVERDPAVAAACHAFLHELGHAAYRKYGDAEKALRFQDDFCVGGYIHGVIEETFSDADDVEAVLGTLCAGHPAKSLRRWTCHHGIGHGLMYLLDNDLPRALAKCDVYADPRDNEACYNGAYMENFGADQKEHFTRFLDDRDPVFPCHPGAKNAISCYMNIPRRRFTPSGNDVASAMSDCAKAGEGFDRLCYYGAGTYIARLSLNDPAKAGRYCALAGEATETCVSGLATGLIHHYLSLEPAIAGCKRIEPDLQNACLKAVADFRKHIDNF